MVCRLPPCEPGRLRGRHYLLRGSWRRAGRVYRTPGSGFRLRAFRRRWLRTGCRRRCRFPGLNTVRGCQVREVGRSRRSSRSGRRSGRVHRAVFRGMGPGGRRRGCRRRRVWLRFAARVYWTRGCGFRFRLSHGRKPRRWLRTGCRRCRRVPGRNPVRGRHVREVGGAWRPARSRWPNGRLSRLMFGGMGSGDWLGRPLAWLLLSFAGWMYARRRDCRSYLTRVLFRRSGGMRPSGGRCRLRCRLRCCAGKLWCCRQLREVGPHRRTCGRFCR
jgi:hypothetical protein